MTVLTVFCFAFVCPYLGGGGGGDTQQIYIRGDSTWMSNPLPFFTKKVPLSYTFY